MTGRNDPLRVTSERVLLVEGTDEVNLVQALMRHRFGSETASAAQIIAAGGRSRFRERLRAVVTAAERLTLRAVGVLRDADSDARAAWDSVRDAVEASNLRAPDAHGGFSDGLPAVGVFIVPDGRAPGALETLCAQSVAGTPGGGCVEQYLDCLDRGGALASTNRDKSFAHAWLASRRDPVARVGEAAKQGEWNFDHPAFTPLARFVERLTSVKP